MRAKINVSLFALYFSLLCVPSVFAAENRNLYSQYRDKHVKIFVAEVKDSTKDHETDLKAIRSKIEDALKGRKSIQFEIVQDPAQAELLVRTDIQEYMWTDHDPVDMLMGAAATAYDIATIEDYARLQADMTVVDVKTNKELWNERVMATITKKPMPRPESIPLVSDQLAKQFIKDCFSRRR